jgi:hypothetical protein
MDAILDNKLTRGCLGITGFMILAVAVTSTIVVVMTGLGTVATVATAVCSAFTGLLGAALCVWGVRGLMARDHSGAEEAILEVAQQTGGQVQVSTVAAQTHLSLREADEVLDELARERVARLDIDEQGNEVYEFPGLEEADFEDTDRPVVFDDRDFNFDRTMRKAAKTVKHVIEVID